MSRSLVESPFDQAINGNLYVALDLDASPCPASECDNYVVEFIWTASEEENDQLQVLGLDTQGQSYLFPPPIAPITVIGQVHHRGPEIDAEVFLGGQPLASWTFEHIELDGTIYESASGFTDLNLSDNFQIPIPPIANEAIGIFLLQVQLIVTYEETVTVPDPFHSVGISGAVARGWPKMFRYSRYTLATFARPARSPLFTVPANLVIGTDVFQKILVPTCAITLEITLAGGGTVQPLGSLVTGNAGVGSVRKPIQRVLGA